MLNSKALTKIQTIVLVAIIVAAVVAGAAYVLSGGQGQSPDAIKIGVCADLDQTLGHAIWQGAVLAAEQVNAEGGVLGRNLTIVPQDDDTETGGDPTIGQNALEKLIFSDEADFILTNYGAPSTTAYQEIAANNKKILLSLSSMQDELTQRVLDDYDKYKYFFRAGSNFTTMLKGMVDTFVVCRELTGFNKIALMYHAGFYVSDVVNSLCENGFDVVLNEQVSLDTMDFSSHFARAEAAGAEILCPFIAAYVAVPYVNEYHNRQSPMVMWGLVFYANVDDFWELTGGKCEHITIMGNPAVAGYPFTSKTLSTRDAYSERWSEPITNIAVTAYDTIRFILVDAIERAGTIETEAVIEALEETDVETSIYRHFAFTRSHDVMAKEIDPNTPLEDLNSAICMFQWQNGVQVPVYPLVIMEDVEATYIYPEWKGPWD